MHSQDLGFGPDYFSFLALFTLIVVATGILVPVGAGGFSSKGRSRDFFKGTYSYYLDNEIGWLLVVFGCWLNGWLVEGGDAGCSGSLITGSSILITYFF